ncbi:MAG: peroxiredoxin [Sulfolobaceae archaeon]
MLKIGDKAPDFEADTDTGERIRLYEILKNKHVILYFYPKDFTPGCTREACSFRDSWPEFQKYNAIVIGVSSDDINIHRNFKNKYNLPFILISDKNKKIRELYDVKGFIIPARVTYVIKMIDGVIVHAYSSQFSPERHVREALTALRRLT